MNSNRPANRSHIGLMTSLSLLGAAALWPLSPSLAQPPPVTPGCEHTGTIEAALQQLINTHGLKDFANPPEPSSPPTNEAARLDLVVDYADLTVLGCPAKLRTYNKAIVGPTIRAKPGDTIHLRLINKLPVPDEFPVHPQQPEPAGHGGHGHKFSFNITNLHTHGLNVAPQGPIDPATGKIPFDSDNVLLELGPGEQQDYRIHIHQAHPTGTFWYHAHVHGATAVQVSSGMAGALIIEGGTRDNGDLDTVPVIGRVKDNQKIFVLQQLTYDETGKVEQFSPRISDQKQRPTLINGQLVPVIRMQPGEVQRWRFIHAGVQENVALAVDGHAIHEVAADGITLGRSVPWAEAPASGALANNTLFLAPGYRSDILVQARKPEPGRKYFVRKLKLDPPMSIQGQERAFARAAAASPLALDVSPVDPADFAPGQILAQLVIEGTEISDQSLPGAAELDGMIPKDLPKIEQAEIDASNAPQTVELNLASRVCDPANGLCRLCTPADGLNCRPSFHVGERQFSTDPAAVRTLKLNTGGKPSAALWTIKTSAGFHPFHIHVNPFQVERSEPDSAGVIRRRPVWKDTILAFKDAFPPLRMRYVRFTGKFVLHCHILQHEDQGMMQMVEITD